MARIPSPGIVPVFSTAASDITGSPVVDGALRAAVDTAALYVGIAGSWVAISGGGGGGVSGSGTAGNITKWVGATAVGNSILSESLGAIQLLHPTSAKLNLTSTNGVDQLALINTPTQKTLASLTTFEVFCGEVFQLNALEGARAPLLTIGQRDALTPDAGRFIYNTTSNVLQYWNGSAWIDAAGGGGGGGNVAVTTPTTANKIVTWLDAAGNVTSTSSWDIQGNVLSNLNDGSRFDMLHTNIQSGSGQTVLTHAGAGTFEINSNNAIIVDATGFSYTFAGSDVERFNVSQLYSLQLPSITTTARDAGSPLSGDAIFNTTANEVQYYNGTSWVSVSGGGGSGNVTVTTPTTAGRVATWNSAAGALTSSTAWSISSDVLSNANNGARVNAKDLSIRDDGVNGTIDYQGGGDLIVHSEDGIQLDALGPITAGSSVTGISFASAVGPFHPPELTSTQRDALTPSTGDIIVNTTTLNLEAYIEDSWVQLNNTGANVFVTTPTTAGRLATWNTTSGGLTNAAAWSITGNTLANTVGGTGALNIGGNINISALANSATIAATQPTGSLSITGANSISMTANSSLSLSSTTNNVSLSAPAAGRVSAAFSAGPFVPPKMTTTARDALTAVSGDQIYNTTTNKLQWYSGSAWIDAEGGGGGGNVNTTLATTANRLPYWTDATGTLSNGSTGPFVSGSGSRMAIGDEDFQALFTVANGAVPTYPFSDIITAVVDTTVAPVGPPTLSVNIKQFDPTNGRLGYDMLANMDASITFGTVANFDNGEAQLVYNSPAGQSGLYFIAGGPVVVGSNSSEPSDALFSVGGNSASTQGYFYPALMDTTGRDSLTPAAGAQCYNTTTNRLQWYDGSGWVDAFPGAGGGNVTTTTPTVAGNVATWNNTAGDLTASSNFSISGNILSNPNTGSTLQLQNLRIEGNPLAMVIAAEGGALSQLNLNSDDTIRFDADSFVFSGAKTERVDMQNIYSIQLPALTTTQRDAQSGVVHDFIYNDTLSKPQYNSGSAWETVGNVHVPNNDVTTANAIATWNSIDRDLTTSTAFTISGNTLENTNAISRVQLDQLRIEGNPLAMYIAAEGGPLSTLNINSDDTIRFDAVDYIFSGTSVEHADFQAIYSIRLPGLTTTQRDAQTGVLHDFIYNDTLGALQFNNGSSWITLAEAGGGGGNVSTTLPTTANRLTWWNDTAGALVNTSNWQVGTFGTQDLANTTSSARITLGPSSNIRNSSGTLFIEGGNGLTLDSNNGMLLTSLAGNVTLNANTQGVNLNGTTINLSCGIPDQINITTTTTTFDPGSGNNIVFNNIPVGTGDTLVLNGSNQLRRSTGGGSGNVTVTTPTTAGRLASWNDAAGDLTASTSFTLSANTLSNAAANARIELGTSTALFNDGSTNLQNFSGAGDLLLFSNNGAAISTNGGGIFLTAAGRLNASATTEPFIPPRLTATARDALTALPGDTIYNTTASKMQWYNGSAWIDAQGSVTTTTPTTANRIATWNNTAGDLTASTGWQISGSALTSTPTLADASFAVGDTSFTYDNTGEFTTLSTNSKDLFVNVREMYLNPSDYFSVQSFGDIFLSTGTGLKLSGINVGTGDTLVLDTGSGNVVRRVTSSRRYKEDIVDYDGMTDLSARLQPRNFRYIGDDKVQIGLIAEEVVEVLPEIVTRDAEGLPNGVDYARLCVALLGELRELHARIARLEEGVNFHG